MNFRSKKGISLGFADRLRGKLALFFGVGMVLLTNSTSAQTYPTFTVDEVSTTEMMPQFPPCDPAYSGLQDCLAFLSRVHSEHPALFPFGKKGAILPRLRRMLSSEQVVEVLQQLGQWLSEFSAPASRATLLELDRESEYFERFAGAPAQILPNDGPGNLFELAVLLRARLYAALAQGQTEDALRFAEEELHLVGVVRQAAVSGSPIDGGYDEREEVQYVFALLAEHLALFSKGQLRKLDRLASFSDEAESSARTALARVLECRLEELEAAKWEHNSLAINYFVEFREEKLPSPPGSEIVRYTAKNTDQEIYERVEAAPFLIASVFAEVEKSLHRITQPGYQKQSHPPIENESTVGWKGFQRQFEQKYRDDLQSFEASADLPRISFLCRLFAAHLTVERFRRERDRLPRTLNELSESRLSLSAPARHELIYERSPDGESYRLLSRTQWKGDSEEKQIAMPERFELAGILGDPLDLSGENNSPPPTEEETP